MVRGCKGRQAGWGLGVDISLDPCDTIVGIDQDQNCSKK